jgi:hypothetical protein
MAPNKPNLRQLAEQGNPEAIASIFNQFFQRKGLQDVQATAERTDGWLYLSLQAPQVPNQDMFVKTIRQGMERIGCDQIHTVQVEGYQTGTETPGWREQIQLQSADLSVFEQYDPESETPADSPPASAPATLSENLPSEAEPDEFPTATEEDSSSPGDTGDTEPAIRKRRRSLLPILGILLLLVLAAIGAMYARLIPGWPANWPRPIPLDLSATSDSDPEPAAEPPATTPPTPEASPSPAASPEPSPSPEPTPEPTPDPWTQGVNTAIEAANLAQNAESQSDWNQVQQLWQQAANFMANVPQNHPQYETAQQKVSQYRQNAEIAGQRAAQAGS